MGDIVVDELAMDKLQPHEYLPAWLLNQVRLEKIKVSKSNVDEDFIGPYSETGFLPNHWKRMGKKKQKDGSIVRIFNSHITLWKLPGKFVAVTQKDGKMVEFGMDIHSYIYFDSMRNNGNGRFGNMYYIIILLFTYINITKEELLF